MQDWTVNAPINLLKNCMPILLGMLTSLLPLGVLWKTVMLLTASSVVEEIHGSYEPMMLAYGGY
eukprot:1139632-Pelagomonas_calceolata.AAC.1